MKQDVSVTVAISDTSTAAALGTVFGDAFMLPLAASEACIVSACGPKWSGKSSFMRSAVGQAVPCYDLSYANQNRHFQSQPQAIFGNNQTLKCVDLGRRTYPMLKAHNQSPELFNAAIASDYGFAENKQYIGRGIVVVEHPSAPVVVESDAIMLMGNPADGNATRIYFKKMAEVYLRCAQTLNTQKRGPTTEAAKLRTVARHMDSLMQHMYRAASYQSTERIALFVLLSEKPEGRKHFDDFRRYINDLGSNAIQTTSVSPAPAS